MEKQYVIVDRERVTIIEVDDTELVSEVVHRELATIIEVIFVSNQIKSWGAYRGIVMEPMPYSNSIKSIVTHGRALQKHEAIESIQGKPLGWDLANCRYNNGLFD